MMQPMPDVRWIRSQAAMGGRSGPPKMPQGQRGGQLPPTEARSPAVRTVTSGQAQTKAGGQTEPLGENPYADSPSMQDSSHVTSSCDQGGGTSPKGFPLAEVLPYQPKEEAEQGEASSLLKDLTGALPPFQPAHSVSAEEDRRQNHAGQTAPAGEMLHQDSSRHEEPQQRGAPQSKLDQESILWAHSDSDILHRGLPADQEPHGKQSAPHKPCNERHSKAHQQDCISVAGLSFSKEDLLLLALLWVLWREKADHKLLLALVYVWLGA